MASLASKGWMPSDFFDAVYVDRYPEGRTRSVSTPFPVPSQSKTRLERERTFQAAGCSLKISHTDVRSFQGDTRAVRSFSGEQESSGLPSSDQCVAVLAEFMQIGLEIAMGLWTESDVSDSVAAGATSDAVRR